VLLAAGTLLFSFGCGQRPERQRLDAHASPPSAADSPGTERVGTDKPSARAIQRNVPHVEISLTMTFDGREVGLRDEIEVPLGSEVAVREDVVWNHAESVNWYSRYWRAWRASRSGDGTVDPAPKKVRTDTGLVLIVAALPALLARPTFVLTVRRSRSRL
jgi:hypothetical protein